MKKRPFKSGPKHRYFLVSLKYQDKLAIKEVKDALLVVPRSHRIKTAEQLEHYARTELGGSLIELSIKQLNEVHEVTE